MLCVKSELHLNQDGVKTGEGIVTLPVRDLFTQIITETGAGVVLTIGTAGSVFDEFLPQRLDAPTCLLDTAR